VPPVLPGRCGPAKQACPGRSSRTQGRDLRLYDPDAHCPQVPDIALQECVPEHAFFIAGAMMTGHSAAISAVDRAIVG